MNLNLEKYKKYRFYKQRDNYSCGPISIINLYKWAGLNYTSKNLPELKKALLTGTGKEPFGWAGTWNMPIQKFLQASKFVDFTHCYIGAFQKAIYLIDEQLDYGGSCIVQLYWNDGNGHFFNIIDKIKDKYVVVNYKKSNTPVELVGKKEIKKLLKNIYISIEGVHISCIYFVHKKDLKNGPKFKRNI